MSALVTQHWRMLRLALVMVSVAACVSCNLLSDVPAYYTAQDIIPDRIQILEAAPPPNSEWTPAEVAILRDLWLGSLPLPPIDPSNAVAAKPEAAALGHHLFFDSRLSANRQIACTSCHRPDLAFTDGFRLSFGTRTTTRNAPTIIGSAYSRWLLWDGHKDSLWAQALEPLEHPDEHGYTRLHAIHHVRQIEVYRSLYEAAFGQLPLDDLKDFARFPASGGPVAYGDYRSNWESMAPPDQELATRIYVNFGKAIAAYERLIVPGPSRFDGYARAVLEGDVEGMERLLTADEVAGLRIFLGPGHCTQCHRGPLLTDHSFHNTGVPTGEDLPPDAGRAVGAQRVLVDSFNCFGPYSDGGESACAGLSSIKPDDESSTGAFKTPTLRSVAETGPYMHAGQFATLGAVLTHYNQAPPARSGQTELKPLGLSETQLDQLEAFLLSLSAPPVSPPELLEPPAR